MMKSPILETTGYRLFQKERYPTTGNALLGPRFMENGRYSLIILLYDRGIQVYQSYDTQEYAFERND